MPSNVSIVNKSIFPRGHRGMPIKVKRRLLTMDLAGAQVPSILLLPETDGRVPCALLLHGFSSSKERLSDTIGRALAARSIASLAIDLPLHGTRDDAMLEEARRNPVGLVQHWATAIAEASAAIGWLSTQDEIDPQRVNATGYSLGSYVALQVAAANERVATVIVAAGGDLPTTPFTSMVRTITDPLRSVRALNGRPLLMLHGRQDRTISPEQAQRLYDAAAQPKELRWYDTGHVLPPTAADDAAMWLLRQTNHLA
jgi:uncharacterized protein